MKTFLNIFSKTVLSIGAVLLSTTGTAWADNTETAAAERCLPVHTIRRTKVVDNQNILFYTYTRKVYINHLPHTCTDLTMGDTFKYATSQSQLCNVDTITVLHETGSGWIPGASCGLGMFEPTTDPEKTTTKQ